MAQINTHAHYTLRVAVKRTEIDSDSSVHRNEQAKKRTQLNQWRAEHKKNQQDKDMIKMKTHSFLNPVE